MKKFHGGLFFVCKREKICYNNRMQKDYGQKPNKKGLFGELTSAQTSGLAYSLAALLPVALSFAFMITVTLFRLTEKEGYTLSDWYLYCSYVLPQLGFALVAVWYLCRRNTSLTVAVKKQKCAPKYYFIAVTLQIGLLCLSELNALFLELLGKFGYEDGGISLPSMDGFGFFGVLLVVAVLPALFEEIIFRGVLLNGLHAFGVAGGALICGALFSLYHQNPAQTLYQFCCGAAFALVAIRSRSILPTVLSHFINNAVILLLTKGNISSFPTPVFVVVMCVSVVCLVASLGYLIFIDKTQPAQKEKRDRKGFFVYALAGIALCAFSWFLTLAGGM